MSFFSDRMKVCFPDITYDFYRTYVKTNRIDFEQYPLDDDFQIRVEDYINTDRDIILANPNNPTGQVLPLEEIEKIVASRPNRMVILDEAYVDYENESAVPLTKKYANLIVVQTFSKSRNLAGARIGFAIASKEIIEDMNKIKFTFNPFNMGELAIAAGTAAVGDDVYLKQCMHQILKARAYTKTELERLGFYVMESHTNFLLVKHPEISAAILCRALKNRGILVRHYNEPRLVSYLRITIGLEKEMSQLIREIHAMMQEGI
ncbi:MAG TPA: histidinol-phosphate transaminase [Lachnospiraceae bacterium]|nr:histidinol-phosphate transaminase [Lachnospiraceae bacterium]